MTMDKDVRSNLVEYEIRTGEDNATTLTGYALKFNTPSTDISSFIEVIDRNALNDVDLSGVLALVNHDYGQVIGKNGKNMKLVIDDVGLRFEITPNNTTYANDLIENMRSNIIDKCSFGFTIADDGDKWERTDDGKILRTISKIKRLYEISIVTLPAYGDTEATLSARSSKELEEILNPSDELEKQLLDIEVGLYK